MDTNNLIHGELFNINNSIKDELRVLIHEYKELKIDVNNFFGNDFKEITKNYNELNSIIQDPLGKIKGFFEEEFKDIINGYKNLKSNVTDFLSNPIEKIDQTFQLSSKFEDNNLLSLIGNIWENIYNDGPNDYENLPPISQNKKMKKEDSLNNLPINLVMNINTLDVDSFNKSKTQLISEAASLLQRAIRNL